jgi:hypothetical protein
MTTKYHGRSDIRRPTHEEFSKFFGAIVRAIERPIIATPSNCGGRARNRPRFLGFFAQVDESDGSATVWRTGPDGVLVSTVRFADGRVERIPNEQFNSGFAAERLIFLTKMR